MAQTMKAAQFHGARDVRVASVPKPTPKSDQVLVEIEWCGLCGSDLHEYLAGPLVIPSEGKPHHMTGEVLPVTLGHEFCGKISHAPEGSALKVGQAVIVDPRLFCARCPQCSKSRTNMCKQWGFLGLSGRGGGLSEMVAVNESMCHVLPDGTDLRFAALIEPLTVARHALKSSGAQSFESLNVLILGGGPVGLAVALDLRVHGVKLVIVSEPSKMRRGQVAKCSDVALNPTAVNIPEECRRLTGGVGADVVFDCAGVMPALKSGMASLRNHGTYVNVAGWETPVSVYGNQELKSNG